ncbi:hypothetical protein HAX54_027069 [Datura stramonium]|uniref:Uncharacterized protein n=1 Tax=Datura stramonium TaxID=4076 RepID=A0ABS8S8H8_DATST|nr:hypothetical protein [Datura stramonium]
MPALETVSVIRSTSPVRLLVLVRDYQRVIYSLCEYSMAMERQESGGSWTQYALLLLAGCFVSQLYASSDVKFYESFDEAFADVGLCLRKEELMVWKHAKSEDMMTLGFLRQGWIPKNSTMISYTIMFGPDKCGATNKRPFQTQMIRSPRTGMRGKKIPDQAAKKPDDWDEDAPMEVKMRGC